MLYEVMHLAFMDIDNGKFILRELAPGVTSDDIIRFTAAEVVVPDDVVEMSFQCNAPVITSVISR